ncbi:MAG: SpoIIE family protein phosphatase [Raineya sp.]|jgi:serine phosphatase RsbU (regulator of sigma subunit)|nr:SpoIIE family protein phosphatase [Raineya sp.]
MPIKTFRKLKSYFVPTNYQSDISVFKKAENVIEATLVGIIFLTVLIPLNFALDLQISAWTVIGIIALLFVSLYLFKRTTSLVLFGSAISLSIYSIVLVGNIETGGIKSPAIASFLLPGIIAFLYSGRKIGIFWMLIGILSVCVLGFLELFNKGFVTKLNGYQSTLFSIFTNSLLSLFLMYIVRFYVMVLKSISRRNVLKTEKMERYNQVLSEQQTEIEGKNKELLNLYEQFNKQNQDLILQKELLQTQNDELTRAYEELIDSIYYTKRIQMALLPQIELVKPHFADLMVLYKPKEILSGDFYWFTSINEYLFLIVADCTGHGIPGAFMTVIGNDLLNHIIKEDKVFSPKQILKFLDKELYKTLQQDKEKPYNVTDGMDIAICRIDKTTKELCFAGAKRPLFVVNKQGVQEIKGSRMGIGGLANLERDFEEVFIKTTSEDVFYMSSDGFTDQFGGENDSKFLTTHFKEKLVQFYAKPLEYQKLYLDELHETWKGFINEQTDDILVVGFKV